MANEDVKDTPESEVSPPKKKSLPMPVIIAVAAVAVGVGGFFAGKMMGGKPAATADKPAATESQTPAPAAGAGEAKPAGGETAAAEPPAGEPGQPANGGAPAETAAPAPSDSKAVALSLDEFTVNLNDPFGKRYANIQMSLEVAGRDFVPKIKEDELLMAKIRDAILLVISSKSFSEMNSVAGKITLKEEIMMRINEILKSSLNAEPVKDVLFPKFLIQ
jgi:flagellar FliL protein